MFVKKCQLFRTKLQYIGNTICFYLRYESVYKTTEEYIRDNLEIKAKTAKQFKSLADVENYLIMFCSNLQKLFKPIYYLTWNGRPFLWTKIHLQAFVEIKSILLKLRLLHLQDIKDKFQ